MKLWMLVNVNDMELFITYNLTLASSRYARKALRDRLGRKQDIVKPFSHNGRQVWGGENHSTSETQVVEHVDHNADYCEEASSH